MTTSILSTHHTHPTQLALLSKLTITALVGYVGLMSYAMAIMAGRLDWRGLAFIGVTLVLAGFIAVGWRWAPLLGALVSGLLLIDVARTFAYTLAHPTTVQTFAFQALFLLALIVGVAAGVGATGQNYRGTAPNALRWIFGAVAVLVATLVMTILLTIPRQRGASLDERTIATLPTLTTTNFEWDQAEIRAKVGETVALRLTNRGAAGEPGRAHRSAEPGAASQRAGLLG